MNQGLLSPDHVVCSEGCDEIAMTMKQVRTSSKYYWIRLVKCYPGKFVLSRGFSHRNSYDQMAACVFSYFGTCSVPSQAEGPEKP
eukprot:2376252-Rhodomonas_salina.2